MTSIDYQRTTRKSKKESNLCELHYILVCIGFTHKQIRNINEAGIDNIQTMIKARALMINSFVGSNIGEIDLDQRDHLLDFWLWHSEWKQEGGKDIETDFSEEEW